MNKLKRKEEKRISLFESRVREALRNQGKTITWLALELGINPPGIYRIFSSGNPTLSTIKKISRALDMPISYFVEA